MKQSLGIIGFGAFTQFMIPHLTRFFAVSVASRRNIAKQARKLGAKQEPLEKVAAKEFVVISTSITDVEDTLKKIRNVVKPGALVFDVCSVKTKPIQLMKKILPKSVEIIGTHPLFGPQSGKNGIKGLRIVVCPVRTKRLQRIKSFFSEQLGLIVLEKTALQHDKEMAQVQALTQFIARALNKLPLRDSEQKTQSFQLLLDLKQMLSFETDDLFFALERENPFAKRERKKFVALLQKIEKEI